METTNQLRRTNTKELKFSERMQTPAFQNLLQTSIQDENRRNRFITTIIAAVSNNPALQECDHASILSAALQCESLGLSPSPSMGEGWIIPYDDKKLGIKKAQFQVGINGIVAMCLRTNQYQMITTRTVHEGEFTGLDSKTATPLFNFYTSTKERDAHEVIGYMAYVRLINGYENIVYISKEDTINWADRYSKAFNKDVYNKIQNGKINQNEMWKYSSPWYVDFDKMGENNALKRCLKRCPKSIEMVKLEQYENENTKPMEATEIADNFFSKPEEQKEEKQVEKKTQAKKESVKQEDTMDNSFFDGTPFGDND